MRPQSTTKKTRNRKSIPIAQRFWDKVQKTDGCWIWTASRDPKGYGRIGKPRKGVMLAHRASWELHFGPIPEGLDVCHTCDNPPCVRPDHLFLGTRLDNMQDAAQKGRTRKGDRNPLRQHPELIVQGSELPQAKLTEDDVRTIRTRYAAGGISQRAIAREYGVCQQLISHIIRRTWWRHVE